ncbi:MAG: hypothetical protein SCH71_06950 [Desulfobulbaceae bacterium]|nr:hypothetical protein [Desulfobulbaceae bacterium]
MEFMFESYIVYGLIATLIMTIAMYIAVAMGIPLDLTWMLGLAFVKPRHKATVYITGSTLQFVNGAVFGIVYGVCFALLGFSEGEWWWGMAFGAVHGVLAGILLGMMPVFHPRIGTGKDKLPPPGYFGRQLSSLNPAVLIILHLIYGTFFGAMYNPLTPG